MAKTEGLFTEKAVSQILREDLPFTPNPFKGIMKPFRLFSQVLLLLGLVMVCAAGSSKAAMQIDGSWFANSLPEDRMDSTVVLPFPSRNGDSSAIIRGVSMGFYLTRRAAGKFTVGAAMFSQSRGLLGCTPGLQENFKEWNPDE